MKYLEQRIEELELEVKLIKAKDKLGEIKINDYAFNPSVNLMSQPDLETVFTSPFNNSEIINNPLANIVSDFNITPSDCEFMQGYAEYPKIIGSWDDLPYSSAVEKKIEKEFGKIIHKFEILNHQWEMDGYGYVVNTGVDCQLVVTDHGKPVAVDKDFLSNKLEEYKQIVRNTEKALSLIK
jgi:hypothetical protein